MSYHWIVKVPRREHCENRKKVLRRDTERKDKKGKEKGRRRITEKKGK
jgi:hypothetical protein